MNTLARPFPFPVRPLHLESISSYSTRVLAANFIDEKHREMLLDEANGHVTRSERSVSWTSVLAAKTNRDLSVMRSTPVLPILHRDGTNCDDCLSDIDAGPMCLLCADGNNVQQEKHFDSNICIEHKRWIRVIGTDPGAHNSQVKVNDEQIQAELVFRKMRRRNLIDSRLFFVLVRAFDAEAVPAAYPLILRTLALLTNGDFIKRFFDPMQTFAEAFEFLANSVTEIAGGAQERLLHAIWLHCRPAFLNLRESLEQGRPLEPVSPHDLHLPAEIAAAFTIPEKGLEPFENYLAVAEPGTAWNSVRGATSLYLPSLREPLRASDGGLIAVICRRGHRGSYFAATVAKNVIAGQDTCRSCRRKEIEVGVDDLASCRPDVAQRLHPILNGWITADKVFATSAQELIWLCEENHVYPMKVCTRSSTTDCPVCTFRLIQPGVNDLATTHPAIAAEWHYEKNYGHDITNIAPGSSTLVWWVCPSGHVYRKMMVSRTQGGGCTHCPKLAKRAKTITAARPDLALEFNRTANFPHTPENLTIGSGLTMTWTCRNGHSFEQIVHRRAAGYTCEICKRRQHVSGVNDIVSLVPRIAAEWHPLKNVFLEPTDNFSRNRTVWWKCHAEGHETQQSTQNRIVSGGCANCSEGDRVEKPLLHP